MKSLTWSRRVNTLHARPSPIMHEDSSIIPYLVVECTLMYVYWTTQRRAIPYRLVALNSNVLCFSLFLKKKTKLVILFILKVFLGNGDMVLIQ